MLIKRIPAGVYAANCYIVQDEATKETAVIDPGGDTDDIVKYLKSIHANVKYILLTHGHADHTGGVDDLLKEYNVPVFINKNDYKLICNEEYMYGRIKDVKNFLEEGNEFKIGSILLKCILTPGHTPGGVSFVTNEAVFTGDSLFLNSIGRTDFSGGDYDTLINSIKTKLMTLPDNLIVYPGHGPQTSIGKEKISNPFL